MQFLLLLSLVIILVLMWLLRYDLFRHILLIFGLFLSFLLHLIAFIFWRLDDPQLDGLVAWHPDLHFFNRAWVAKRPVGLEDISALAICALSRLAQWLILFIIDFPLDLVVASLAQMIEGRRLDPLRQLAVVVQLELGLVLVLLPLLLTIRGRHSCDNALL